MTDNLENVPQTYTDTTCTSKCASAEGAHDDTVSLEINYLHNFSLMSRECFRELVCCAGDSSHPNTAKTQRTQSLEIKTVKKTSTVVEKEVSAS